MGAVCCCLRAEDYDDQQCICLRCFVHPFANVYSVLFRRGEVPSAVSGTATLASQVPTSPSDSSMPETFRAPPRPLPYDIDPRCLQFHRATVMSRREKASSHCHEETEPLRLSNASSGEQLSATGKWSALYYEDGSKVCPNSSILHPIAKYISGEAYILNSSEDEDVCPTCLEEYTLENPKIVTQCSHHFHLGCIYEWMERSETCPVCGKVMVFDETS